MCPAATAHSGKCHGIQLQSALLSMNRCINGNWWIPSGYLTQCSLQFCRFGNFR